MLLLHNGGVYKTTRFGNPAYVGDPINAIRLFNDLEVDEICVLDIDASKISSEPDYDMISDLASEAFMPFSYGGGIVSLPDAIRLLRLGVEKVVVNHSVQGNPSLIRELADEIGSQSVVVSIDYKKKVLSGKKCYDHVSGKSLGYNVVDIAVEAEQTGAGELLINSVDRDGMMAGLDLDTIAAVSQAVNVPLIACGGAGSLEHLSAAKNAGASAVAAGSMFVYHGKQKGVLINYPNESTLRNALINRKESE